MSISSFFKERKAKNWTKKQIDKNLRVRTPIDCTQYIHEADKTALLALRKIPLLDKVCTKLISTINDANNTIIHMSSFVHITENQLPKIHLMVKSICHKLGIGMPELYLKLDRHPNASVYGAEKFTLIIHSGLLECFEDDEIYAVLAHECGHIACNHVLYHTIARLALGSGSMTLNELSNTLSNKGILGNIAGNIISLVDSALELALYHWYRCSELSADRIAAICCGNSAPVVETMIRLAGGTTQIGYEINKDLFIEQAQTYQLTTSENKLNKTIEFLYTKDSTHPLLAVRAYEIQQFANSEEFQEAIKS